MYLARGDVFADALAAGMLTDGPVLLVPSCAAVPQPVAEEIGRLDPASVVALGGPQAVCAKTLTEAAAGRSTSRLAGDDRYGTAVAISRYAFPRGPVPEVYLARGDAPDAAAGGVLTAGPILLTPAGRLPQVVTTEIARLDPARVVALGGPQAVSDRVLITAAKGRGSSRLAGADRYDTALRIAAYRFPASNRAAYLARGDVYADAIAAGVLTDGPIVLLPSGCRALPPAVAGYLASTAPSHVFALGGPNAVCDAALVAAARAASAATPGDGSSPGATTPAPGSTPAGDGQDVTLTAQAEVLTPVEQRELDTYDQSTGAVTVDAANGLPGVTVGDVLVAGVTPATPEGLLRRVVGITDLGEQVAYATTQAALTDVIADTGGPVTLTAAPLSVDATAYDGATLDNPTARPSAATLRPMAATTGSAEVSFTVDQAWVAATGNESDSFRGQGSVSVNGTVATGAQADLVVDISWARVKRLKATITPYERTSAEVALEGVLTGRESTEIGKTTRTYLFSIGPVPVVVTESSGLELSIEAATEARLSTGVEQYSQVTAGFDYDDGDFAVIAETSGRAQRKSLDPSGKVSTTLQVGPKTDVKFYGVAGTTTEWGGYFTAGLTVGTAETTCNWEAGLRGAVGVVAGVDVLGLRLEKEATTGIQRRISGDTYDCTLGGGGGPPGALAIITVTLPTAYVGQNYQGSMHAAGGTAPYTWSITTGTLPPGLTLDASGRISGTPAAGGTSSFAIRVTDSSGATASKSLTLDVSDPGQTGTGGTGASGWNAPGLAWPGASTPTKALQPTDVAIDTHGNYYIADVLSPVVWRVDAATGLISTVAGNGVAGYSGDGGPATSAQLDGPSGVAVDSAGNLYIADTGNERVRRVDAATGLISTVAGNGVAGYSGDGGPATSARLDGPSGVAVDSAGNLYIADTFSHVVRRVDAVSGLISTVAGNGVAGFSGDGGPATSTQLYRPSGVAVDSAGNLYIADTGNERVRRVDAATGVISTVAGNGHFGTALDPDGVPATSAQLAGPNGVAIDAAGNLYIADTYGDVVRRVDAATGVISTVAGGNGGEGYSGDGGPATSAQLWGPQRVAVDASGNLFIVDFNQAVRRVDAATRVISTVVGKGT